MTEEELNEFAERIIMAIMPVVKKGVAEMIDDRIAAFSKTLDERLAISKRLEDIERAVGITTKIAPSRPRRKRNAGA